MLTHVIIMQAGGYSVEIPEPEFVGLMAEGDSDEALSPTSYPCVVNKVFVSPGDMVEKGTILMTVEGMKMETNIIALRDGQIKDVLYSAGDQVPPASTVVDYEPEETKKIAQ
jgi:biotin carboxyl carrier protein